MSMKRLGAWWFPLMMALVLLTISLVQAQTPATGQPVVPAADQSSDQPPKSALLIKLQDQVLDLQLQVAQLSGENAALKKILLDEAKKRAAADILREWGGKPGETIDWTQLRKIPAPQRDGSGSAAPLAPSETKKP